jgi:hypothetical protein
MLEALTRPAMEQRAPLADRPDKTETPPPNSSSRARSEGAASHHPSHDLAVESGR